MRGVAVSLYARWRESLTPESAVSPMQGVTYKNFKKENSAYSRCGKSHTPCIAVAGSCRPRVRVLQLRGVFDPAYGRNGESDAAYGQYGKSRRFR